MESCYLRLHEKWKLFVKWLCYLLWWSPSQLRKFSTDGVKTLFWDFQYTLYSSQIAQLFTVNIVLYMVLELLIFTPQIELMSNGSLSHIINGLGMVLHIIFLGIKVFTPKTFKRVYLAFVIISVVLYRSCLFIILHNRNILICPAINSLIIILELMVVLYFQSNTILMAIGIFDLLEIIIYKYVTVKTGDMFEVTEVSISHRLT